MSLATYQKYRNIKCEADGYTFASKAEYNRYQELKLLQRTAHIKNLELQPKYAIIVNSKKICTYIADYRYFDCDKNQVVVEDVKGVKTAVYRIKKKLVEALYNIIIQEV